MIKNQKPSRLVFGAAALLIGTSAAASVSQAAVPVPFKTVMTASVFGSSQEAEGSVMVDGSSYDDAAASEQGESLEQQGALKPPSSSSSAFSNVKDDSLDELMSQVQANLPNDGVWACYVCDLQNDTEGSFGSRPMQSASLIKLFIMGAVYEKYDVLAASYGAETLDRYLRPMITISDNDAANTLVQYLGGGDSAAGMAAVNSFCLEHGYTGTSMGRLLLQSNEFGDNFTTVEDCGHLFKEIYEVASGIKTDSTLAHCDAMFDLLKAQQLRNKIPAQMPAGVKVANKTGELTTVENDAGIIYDTGKNDCVIVFMSENLTSPGYAQGAIAANSAAIYKYFNDQSA